MARSHDWEAGRRNGIKWAITWLHVRANEMGDSHAKAILNTAGFNMGVDAKCAQGPLEPLPLCRAVGNTPPPKWISDYEKRLLSDGGPNEPTPSEN